MQATQSYLLYHPYGVELLGHDIPHKTQRVGWDFRIRIRTDRRAYVSATLLAKLYLCIILASDELSFFLLSWRDRQAATTRNGNGEDLSCLVLACLRRKEVQLR